MPRFGAWRLCGDGRSCPVRRAQLGWFLPGAPKPVVLPLSAKRAGLRPATGRECPVPHNLSSLGLDQPSYTCLLHWGKPTFTLRTSGLPSCRFVPNLFLFAELWPDLRLSSDQGLVPGSACISRALRRREWRGFFLPLAWLWG